MQRVAVPFLAGLLFAVACGGGEPSDEPGVVIERVAELRTIVSVSPFRIGWVPFERSPGDVEPEGLSGVGHPRFRLTVDDPDLPAPYKVGVTVACFDAIAVGDAWPSARGECR